MPTTRLAALCAAGIAFWTVAACRHVDASSPDDAGSDADTDSGSDADTDPCAEVQPYCCTGDCPCAEVDDRCVLTYDGALADNQGVCKPESSGDECWEYSDCAEGEFCAGVAVCPCEMDCYWEGPGICSPVSGSCCEDPGVCQDDYFCLTFTDGTDTCHGILDYPQCWTNDDCFGGTCEGEVLCACDVDCISVPGICWMYEYK